MAQEEAAGEGGALEIGELFFFHLVAYTKRAGTPGKEVWHPWSLGGDMHSSLEEACEAFGIEPLPEAHPRASEGFFWMRAQGGTGTAVHLLYKHTPHELKQRLPKRRPNPFFDFDKDVRWAIQQIRLFT